MGDISNEDPSNEVPDENEPSEGDVEDPAEEEPVEEEVEVPAITPNQMTIMSDPDTTSYTVTLPGDDAHATVAIISGAEADEDGVYKTDAAADIVFSVTPDEGFDLATANAVQYKVGTDGTLTDATEDGTNYKIAKEAITGDITIQVATAEIDYTIGFDVTGAKVKVGEEDASENPAAVTKNLGDTVTFVVTPNDGMKLRYVNTADNDTDAMEPTSTDAEAGTYTFAYTVDATTAEATTIYVNATAAKDVAVSFDTGSDTSVSVYEVKETGTDTKVLTVEATAVSGSITAKEDSKVYFIAEPSETSVSKIVSVKVDDEDVPHETKTVKRTVGGEEKDVEVDLYTLDLKDITAAVQVDIATELDETKANVATFSLAGEGEYTATVDGEEYTAGDKLLTAADSITFQVAPTETYFEIDKVEAVYEADKEDGTGKEEKTVELVLSGDDYTFAFKSGDTKVTRVVDIKVTVSTKATEEEKTITFNNISNQTKYKVAVKDEAHPDEKVTKKAGTNHTYVLEKGAKYVNVTVTVSGKYEPWVGSLNQEDEELSQYFKGQKTEEAGVYRYAIPAAALADGSDTIVTIGAKAEQKWIAVLYNGTEVTVSAKVSGQEIFEGEDFTDEESEEFGKFDSEYVVYKVPTDTEITVAVKALDNSSVKSYTIGSKTTNLKVASGKTGEFKVKAADNTTVQINTESVYAITLKDAAGNAVVGANGTYTVDYGTAYTAVLLKGDARANVTAVAIEGSTDGASTAVAENGIAKITVATADANKTLTVKLSVAGKVTAEDGTEQDGNVVVHTFKLSVKPKATKLEIKGAKNGKLTQPVDTLTEYVITPTPKTINLSNIEAEVTAVAENADAAAVALAKDWVPQAVVTAEGKLAVTTKAVKDPADQADAAKIVLKDKTTKDVISSVTVDVTKPALMDQTPGVKAVGSDDVSLKLELSTPNKVTPPNAGKLWYKVLVTTDDTNAGEEITNTIAKPFYIAKGEAASQIEDIKVNSKRKGEGKACSFKVAVTLVQTLDKTTDLTTAEDAAITAATSCVSKSKEGVAANTKTPYYTSKLSLKKGATTVYTGQKVKIATPQFDKNTTFTDIEAENIIDTTDANSDKVSFTVENGDIYMHVAPGEKVDYDGDGSDDDYESTPLGKHTIEVTAFAPDYAYAAKATLTVNVVRGIEQISLSAPDTIYKADKKAATLKLTPSFNWGSTDKNRVPKAKKVTYEIVEPYFGNPMSAALKAAVTVKANGTVTVAKNYNVSASQENNMFAVKVTATDFAGNTVSDVTDDIEITSTGMGLGEVCIADKAWVEDDDLGYQVLQYTVLPRKTSFTSKELNGKYLIVLKPGIAEKENYSENEVIEAKNLTYKSSNKALTINAAGGLSVSKTANNVKLTATANDGSKKSVDKTINIVYDEPAQLGLRVERLNDFDGEYYPVGDDNSSAFTFKGTTDTVLQLTVVQRDNDESEWKEVDQITNFKLTPSGAKILNKNSQFNQTQLVIANKAVINVKLTIGSGKDKKDQTYTITNESFSNVKAPKVKGSGNLKTWLWENQTITYQVTDTKPETYSGKKWVMVTTDATDRAKKPSAYWNLEHAANGGLNGYHPIDKNGRFDLNFAIRYQTDPDDEYNWYQYNIPSGNYKLQLTFGTVDDDGAFIPETKTVAVTLKAEAQKKVKGSYKAVSSVKMSLKDGATVRLAGTGKNYSNESFGGESNDELYNANINGAPNNFRKYFDITSDWNDAYEQVYYLTLKPQGDGTNDTLTADDIAYITGDTKEAKNDRIGYVPYSVYIDGIGWKNDTAKITVNFDKNVDKTLLTYKASVPTIMEGTTEEFKINVTAGKANAKLAYAYLESDTFEAVDMYYYYDSVINVKAKAAPAVGNYATAVYVVPSDSYYVSEVGAAYEAWTNEQDETNRATKFAVFTAKIKDRGVPVNTTIKVTAKANTSGKIKIDKKDTAQIFSQDKYNAEYMHYFVHVPYTKTMPCNITEIASNDTYLNGVTGVPEGRKNLFDFYADPDEYPDAFQAISVTMDKDYLKKALDAKKVQLGKTYTVKATVKFGAQVQKAEGGYEWKNDDTIKTETITLKLTLPKTITTTGYTEAVAAVKEAKAEIIERVSADLVYEKWWNEYKEVNGISGQYAEWILEEIIMKAINALDDEISKLAPEDSGTSVIFTQVDRDNWYNDYNSLVEDENVFKAPTSQQDGYFKAVIRLAKTAEYNEENDATYEDITFELPIAKTMEEPNDLEAALNAFVATMADNEAYTKAQNEWEVRTAILRDARADVEISKYPTLRMSIENVWEEDDYDEWIEVPFFTPATDQGTGSIKGQFHVWGIRYGGKELYVPFTVTLAKLDNISETKGKIEAVLTTLGADATNLMTQDEVMDAAKAAIVNKQFELEWKQVENPNKNEEGQPEMIDEWNLDPATRSESGTITGTLILVNTKATEEDGDSNKQVEITISWTIPQQEGSDTAITNLRDALGITEAGIVDTAKAAVFKALVISNDSDTVQAAILAAAEKAVEKDGFSVAYKKDGDKVAFEFTKAMYKAGKDADGKDVSGKGSVEYTLVVTDEQAAEGATDASQDVTCSAEFGPYPELATLTDAKSEVEAALKADTYLATLTNETTAASISTAAQAAITEGANIDVAVKQDADGKDVCTLTKATFAAAGKIEITLVLSKYEMVDSKKQTVGEPLDVALELVIAKLTQTIEAAETAAGTALNDESLVFTNDDIKDDDAKTATMNKILDAVKKVVNTEAYDVTAKGGKITATEATINAAGSVGITVVITEKNPAENQEAAKKEIDKTYTIAELDQSLAEAKTAAEGAIDAYAADSEKLQKSAADEAGIKAAVEAVVKASKFTVAWSTETDKGFKLTAAAAAAEGGEATPGSITGEIVISETGTDNSEPVTVNITWPYEAPEVPVEP